MNTTTVDLFSELNTRLAQEKVDEEAAIARRGALIEESKGLEVQVAALRTELDLLKVDKKACAKELDTLEAAATAAAARRARMSTIMPDPQPCRVCAVAPRVLVSRSTQTDPTADTAGALPSMPGLVVVGAPTGTSNASAVAADGNGGSEAVEAATSVGATGAEDAADPTVDLPPDVSGRVTRCRLARETTSGSYNVATQVAKDQWAAIGHQLLTERRTRKEVSKNFISIWRRRRTNTKPTLPFDLQQLLRPLVQLLILTPCALVQQPQLWAVERTGCTSGVPVYVSVSSRCGSAGGPV
eukprot:GHVU01010755.1.p1 GENE.GHVU01010755.1~~GHVU01010755.1.p1  ORF type:complete len:299 (+),score=26.38 GHVU01010755.1:1707-2603(+)